MNLQSNRNCAVIVLLLGGWLVAPSLGQPAAGHWTAELGETVAREWGRLHDRHVESELEDPAAAIGEYRKFYQAQGYRDPATSVRISSLVAQLYAQGLGDHKKALQIYEWAIPLYGLYPEGERLKTERDRLERIGTAPDPVLAVDSLKIGQAGPVAPEAVIAMPRAATINSGPVTAAVRPGAIPGALEVPIFGGEGFDTVSIAKPQQPNQSQKSTSLNLASIRVPVLLEDLRRPGVTLEGQFAKGAVSVDDIFYALNTQGLLSTADLPLQQQMVDMLLRELPEKLKPSDALSDNLKFALAAYFADRKDERVVAMYQSLVEPESPERRTEFNATQSLDRLAAYYRATSQPLKAAQSSERIFAYTKDPSWHSIAAVDAARCYRQAGQLDKAQELYAGVAKQGYTWGTCLMLYDQASALIAEGRHIEARKLLSTPVKGLYADQSVIPLLSLMGRSYFETGDLKLAEQYSRQAVDGFAAVANPLKEEGLEAQVEAAQAILRQIESPPRAEISVDRKEIKLVRGSGLRNVRQWIIVRTRGSVDLQVAASDPRLVVALDQDKSKQDDYWEYGVSVKLDFKRGAAENFTSHIEISDLRGSTGPVLVPVSAFVSSP